MAFLYRRGRSLRGLKAERGFTLLELFISMTVLAILVAFALPSFRSTIRNTNVSNYTNDLVTALATARSEAVRRGRPVAVESISNSSDWSTGWRVIADTDGSTGFGGADEVISTTEALDTQYKVFANNTGAGGSERAVFNINGALASGEFDMNVCFPTGEAAKSRRVRVRASGSVSSHKNTSGSTATACPGS